MINIKNLSKQYNDQYVLKNINLSLPSKGLIGISGESGSGKSTLLNALSLMDSNFEGEIIINNKNILKYNDEKKDKYHLNIGYIFQNPYLFNFETVYENIKYTSLIKGKKHNIDDILRKVDLLKFKNKKVKNLSGGQKQRVSIASNLISDPFMLLCDEPTGALDSFNSEKVMEVLKEISKDKLVIVVSHDLDLLEKYADRILYIKEGRIEGEINIESSSIKLKNKRKINHLIFILKFVFSNLFNKKKRTILTSIMISFGIIGLLFSIIIKDGFSSYFTYTFKEYEANKYVYGYKINENEVIDLYDFNNDFSLYKKGYTYHYDFKENKEEIINKISINKYDSFLNFNNLSYIKEVNKVYKKGTIGLRLTKNYLDYYYALFNVKDVKELNKYLVNNEVNLNFRYLDSLLDLDFNLRIINVEESNDYTYFIHNDSTFLFEYLRKYISLDLDTNLIKIIPYIINEEKDKKDLFLNDKLKKYDYLFNNKIYGVDYTFVFNSIYHRISVEDVNKMNELIDSNYYLSINNGINMMGYFDNKIKFLNKEKIINGNNVSFIPLNKNYSTILDVDISSGLFNLLNGKIYINGYDKEYLLKINEVIENDDLVIYQASEWSYKVFESLFDFEEYELVGASVAFSKNDDKTIDLLKRSFNDYEFICPLKELSKEIDSLIEKIQLVLMVLSSFCVIMSILLMFIIVFINTIEEEKIISILRINGISKKEVIFIYLLESIFIGLISLLISFYMSTILSIELNVVFNMLINGSNVEFISLKKDILINVFIIVMLLSILSSLIPSLLASKKNSLKILKS